MKYTFSYKLSAILLALLVLFSSLSYSIEKHFCEGEVHASLFFEAEDLCTMHDTSSHDSHHDTCCSSEFENDSCCSSSTEYITGLSITQQAQPELKVSLFPIFLLISNYFISNPCTTKTSVQEIITIPPKIPDLRVLHQVFII